MLKKTKRYLPEKNFPAYSFLPGVNAHPNLDGGYRFRIEDPKLTPINLSAPFAHEALRFSLDLFNHEYFWESHIYLEALWNAHEREGVAADFLKGLIKLAAAGVKLKVSELGPAHTHLKNARGHFERVHEKEGSVFLGFGLQKLLSDIDSAIHANLGQTRATSTHDLFEIHPEWD